MDLRLRHDEFINIFQRNRGKSEMAFNILEYRRKKGDLYKPYIEMIERKIKFDSISVNTKYGVINASIYYPNERKEKMPVYFNFHGGGFVLNFYQQDGFICEEISKVSDYMVVNIEYLVAPEHKFPIPVLSSAEFIVNFLKYNKKIDINHLAIGGFSAGGNIAIGTCLLLREQYNIEIEKLIPVYAPMDFSIDEESRNSEFPELAITPERMKEYKEAYLNSEADEINPLASPIYADTKMFPSMLIISAEFDSFRDEEERLAKKLLEEGKDVKYKCYSECTHGFTHEIFNFNQKQAKKAINQICLFLQGDD